MSPTLPSPFLLRTAAYLLGGVGLFTGVQSILSPLSYARTFGLPQYGAFPDPPSSKSSPAGPTNTLYDAPTPNPFAITTGIRNMAFGLAQCVLAYRGDWAPLGALWVVGVVVAGGDAWVMRGFGEGEERAKWVGHAVGGVVMAGAGGWVLGAVE